MMTAPARPRCIVEGCRCYARRALPMPDGTELDLPVCAFHYEQIHMHPDEWRITSTSRMRPVVKSNS